MSSLVIEDKQLYNQYSLSLMCTVAGESEIITDLMTSL